ncbi:MAG: adenosine deaminase [Actinomycetota bacterium]|nr:adenosine deaminase [Actinomycetota bacterium]
MRASAEAYRHLPKALLHDHLDGGLRVETVIELARQSGYEGLPTSNPQRLAEWFDQGRSGSLPRYLEAFRHTVSLMQTAPAIERVAYEAVLDLAADGVLYAELRFAPMLLCAGGLDPHQVVEAALAGLRQGEAETGMVARLILDAMRQEDDSDRVAGLALAFRGRGVVAFDLAGPELGFPADRHLSACRRVREGGLPLTLHAGEADGPHSIWTALERCGAQRIGHGVRIVDDTRLVDGEVVEMGEVARYVREHRVPLEICISSNLHTGSWDTAAEHPAGALQRAGFAVTLNTDNRLMSATSMSGEFALAAQHLGFGIGDLQAVTERALRAAFCDWPIRRRLLEERIRPAYEELG